jgi:RHS repeat-associated protein
MIRAGGSTIIVSRQTAGTNSVHYVTGDHLGSSSAITNSSGSILVNSSFDAFGKRRGSNWSGTPSAGDWTALASTTRRGYTDHTMLDNLNLIHMNGRMQDPLLGRFASADPYITEPGFTQNFNRYSYVYNNPLSFTDPSGFDCEDGTPDSSEDDTDPSKPGGSGYQNGSSTASSVAECMEEIEVTGRRNQRGPGEFQTWNPSWMDPLAGLEEIETIVVTGRKTTEGQQSDPCGGAAVADGGGYADYVMVSAGGQVSPIVVGGSFTNTYLWKPGTSQVHSLWTVSGGVGLGFSAGAILQVGVVGLESVNDITGFGTQVSGFLAGGSWGMSATAIGGSGNLPWVPGAQYSGFEGGTAYGGGASISAEATYTGYAGKIEFASAPENVRTALCAVPR